ncbi:MAG: hypothetical protein EWV90_07620 [Microcystis aeruginosa Ma_QC_Ch_20071001_M135]|nr:MAG: hypothetical protein EWV90_07620 [Microcystis aeruginosa Ma_QC_Ch_20071001_M135]
MITLVIMFFAALLAAADFTYQVLIHFPVQILNFLGSLLSYGVIGLIIFVLVWIVGDFTSHCLGLSLRLELEQGINHVTTDINHHF